MDRATLLALHPLSRSESCFRLLFIMLEVTKVSQTTTEKMNHNFVRSPHCCSSWNTPSTFMCFVNYLSTWMMHLTDTMRCESQIKPTADWRYRSTAWAKRVLRHCALRSRANSMNIFNSYMDRCGRSFSLWEIILHDNKIRALILWRLFGSTSK